MECANRSCPCVCALWLAVRTFAAAKASASAPAAAGPARASLAEVKKALQQKAQADQGAGKAANAGIGHVVQVRQREQRGIFLSLGWSFLMCFALD